MPTANPKKCSVCFNPMEGNYCSQCGQRYTGRRVTQSTVLRDLLDNLYGLDRSMLANIWLALKAPQFLVQNFWNGYRNYYFGPGRFFIIAALSLLLNFLVTEESFLLVKIESHDVAQQFVFLFIALIIFTFSSYLAYWWPWKKNIAEHAVMNIYTVGLWTILFTPISIVGGLLPNPVAKIFNANSFLVFIALILIWNARVFPIKSWFQRVGYILVQAGLIVAIFWGMTFLG